MANNRKIIDHLIGCMVSSPDLIIEHQELMRPGIITIEPQATIYNSILSLLASGESIDVITISEKSNLSIEEISQFSLSIQPDIRFKNAILLLNEAGIESRLTRLAQAIITNLSNRTDVFQIIEKATTELSSIDNFKISNAQDFDGNITEFREYVKRKQSGQIVGIPTGFSYFDKFSGGLHNTDLIIIAAETSNGKTTLAGNIAVAAAYHKYPVLFISFEMSKLQLTGRMVASDSHIKINDLFKDELQDDQRQDYEDSCKRLSSLPIYIDSDCTTSIVSVCTSIRSYILKYKIKLVIIDYLQLMKGNEKSGREQEVGNVARTLKNLAKELNIPIIALSQLSRNNDPVPSLKRLRDSGQIEEAADVVIFIYRAELHGLEIFKDGTPAQGVALIDVAKGRNIGITQFYLRFIPAMFKFANYGDYIKEDLSGVLDGINAQQGLVGNSSFTGEKPVDDNPF